MKKAEWETPNKMKFESDHLTFNRQTNDIGPGIILSNTQYSTYIRAKTDTWCNDRRWEEGKLRELDLKFFRKKDKQMPRYVLERVLAETEDKSIILYCFFHHTGYDARVVHGYVLTTEDHKLIASFVTNSRSYAKSRSVIETAIPYISEEANPCQTSS